ncbi:glycoside hydrolase family 28 protein [Lophiostoma macrostomum CBS 122681]|uniref:Glycoside hydrolase family 28 protein n=1 Tax=Lophiostoma macrostomum CBS 122681 TaxID=1314788 RepID=A0A6A6TBW1_9PLEO|nr:glycoside hydrolase family 28 protein [Lophiostoma macrostomum CBS 122681]
MICSHLLSLIYLAGLSIQSGLLPPNKRAPCTVLAGGYEAIDDAIAINTALKDCGNGGTIVLPSDQVYSIRSPIDFAQCHDCDVQLEGELLFSNDQSLWANQSAFISFDGVDGAKFRSLTGKGLVDGNAKTYYQRPRDHVSSQPALVPIVASSDVYIDGLVLRNPPLQFFRVDGGSSMIHFSNLKLTVENQWWQSIWTDGESIGFQFRNSTHITLESVDVDFRSNYADYHVGACVGIDYITSDIYINNVNCNNTDTGVLLQFGSLGGGTPAADDQWAKNIFISNYTANSKYNTGFMNMLEFDYSKIWNVTYDGVKIIGGNQLTNTNCYVVSNGITDACSCGHLGGLEHLQANFTDIRFKNYSGETSKPALACSCHSTCDFHFDGWSI